MGVDITTAVDSLVKLVKEKKKISVEEASKLLKIPENIINEWASFLEEEKIIQIEYKFTTPFLIDKKQSIKSGDISSDDLDLVKRNIQNMLSKVRNSNIPKTGKLNDQKIFLSEQLKKILSSMKTAKDYDKVRCNYDKLVKYYMIFQKSLK